jgi:hypothetical protein
MTSPCHLHFGCVTDLHGGVVTLSGSEIPGRGGGPESLPEVTKLNRGIYVLVFWILGIALVLLIVGWVALSLLEKPVPEGLPVVTATIVGALVGAVSGSVKDS